MLLLLDNYDSFTYNLAQYLGQMGQELEVRRNDQITLDEIEDLRIAVDEACAMLLSQAIPGTNLECAFDLGAEEMTITVSVTAAEPQIPARDTFAWTVLSALAGTVDSRLEPDDQVAIVLRKRKETPKSGAISGSRSG